MGFKFESNGALAAWLVATSQTAQLEGLRDVWAGQMSVRYYSSADAHLATVTHETPIVDTSTDPYSLRLGAYVAEAHYTDGTAAYAILAVPAGADILRCDVTLAGPISDPGGRVRTDIGTTLRVHATAGLPALDTPAWLVGVAVNEAVELASTIIRYGEGPGTRLAYSGLAVAGTEVILACTGGHNDCKDNGVDGIDLADNAPAWAVRRAAWTGATPTESNYYRTTPTVEPSSRHTYDYNAYNPVLDRLMLYTTAVPWGNSSPEVPQATNGFNLATNEFDAAGTYTAAGGCVVQDSAGRAYGKVSGGYFQVQEFVPPSTVNTLTAFSGEVGYPIAYDSSRGVFFQCSWGDGRGGGGARLLHRYAARFASQTAIAFNSSAAATALNALADADAVMTYSVVMNAYVYWSTKRVFIITPNTGTTWDVAERTLTGATLPSASHAHNRGAFIEMPSGEVVVAYLPSDGTNLYAIRIA